MLSPEISLNKLSPTAAVDPSPRVCRTSWPVDPSAPPRRHLRPPVFASSPVLVNCSTYMCAGYNFENFAAPEIRKLKGMFIYTVEQTACCCFFLVGCNDRRRESNIRRSSGMMVRRYTYLLMERDRRNFNGDNF